MTKKLFRCTVCNDIHYGINGPEICPTCQTKNAYIESNSDEAGKSLPNKKYFRCNVCNDIHFGANGPLICPTCQTRKAYCEIDKNEFQNVVFGVIVKENLLKEDDLKGRIWPEFTEDNDFKLNTDNKPVDMVAKGVLQNELRTGLKMCPCRLSDGKRESDLKIICPCNFKIQDTWVKNGRCWCNLFVKK